MLERGQNLDALISVLARTYEQIFMLEKTAQRGQLYVGGTEAQMMEYDTWCDLCAEDYAGDDRKLFLRKVKKEAVLEALRFEDDYVIEYSVRQEGEAGRKRMRAFLCCDETILCIGISDITQQFEKEQMTQQFNSKCMQIAHECNAAKGQFYQRAEQELRGPLYSMQGMLEQALAAEEENTKQYIQQAKDCLEQYAGMLDKLLLVSEMEKGGKEAESDVIVAEYFLSYMQDLIKKEAERKQVAVAFENENPEIVAFESDAKQIRQMLFYICELLMKYAADNASLRVMLSFDDREETEEEIEVFDVIFRIHADQIDVSGIREQEKDSMSLLQYVADSLGGMLRMEEDGKAVDVLLRIPVQHPDEEDEREMSIVMHLADSIQERDFSAYRALVVDDDACRRRVTAAKLEAFGLSVDMASGGQEAIDMLVAAPMRYYHIMFINPMLPDKSGYETTMELREMQRIDLNDITIVALTPNALRDDRLKALEHGMDYHMQIPFDDIEMKEILIRELQDLGPDDEHEVFGFRVIK